MIHDYQDDVDFVHLQATIITPVSFASIGIVIIDPLFRYVDFAKKLTRFGCDVLLCHLPASDPIFLQNIKNAFIHLNRFSERIVLITFDEKDQMAIIPVLKDELLDYYFCFNPAKNLKEDAHAHLLVKYFIKEKSVSIENAYIYLEENFQLLFLKNDGSENPLWDEFVKIMQFL